MTKLAKKIILAMAGATLLIVIVAISAAWYLLHTFDQAFTEKYPHRSDAEMISNFHEHRNEFERVRLIATDDKEVMRIDEDWTQPANLDPAKVAEYRGLFAVIGTPRGLSKYSGRVELIASTLGWVASGSAKGYLYMEGARPEGEWPDSLDDTSMLSRLDVYYLKPIEGNWYLYFQRS